MSRIKSDYDNDYSFVDIYDKDMKAFGKVRDATMKKINDKVIFMNDHISAQVAHDFSYAVLEYDTACDHNEAVIERERCDPKSPLPYYVEEQMMKMPDENPHDEIQNMWHDFYNAVYEVESILPDKTLRCIGGDASNGVTYDNYSKSRHKEDNRYAGTVTFSDGKHMSIKEWMVLAESQRSVSGSKDDNQFGGGV